MRVAWLTDIHLNFLSPYALDKFLSEALAGRPDAVIISGDIGESPNLLHYLRLMELRWARPIYFVLGNHDYYRSSIAAVTRSVESLCARSRWLRWLNTAGVIELGPGVGLVGHDGWADGRLGDYAASEVVLEDYVLIDDLAGLDKSARLDKLHQLGDAAAAHLRAALPDALARYEQVYVVLHPPPFRESCWHEGRFAPPDDPYLPHFTCKAAGDVLYDCAQQHPARRLMVLCGHTHGAGQAQPLPNLHVLTGGAEYGRPAVQQVFEIGG